MEKFDLDNSDIVKRLMAENATAFAFLNRMPIVPGHTLVCPKRAISASGQLSVQEWSDILALKEHVCAQLTSSLAAEGFNFAWNEGATAGQTVPHFHLHILPRKVGDSGVTQYEPRSFLYRPGVRPTSPDEELESLAALLRTASKESDV